MPKDNTSQSKANENKDKLKQEREKNQRSTEFGKVNDPNYDPSQQNDGIDAGKPSNPDTPTPRDMSEKKGLHPVVMTDDKLKASGKHVGGNPNEPIVTRYPTSVPVDPNKDKFEPIAVSDANELLVDVFGSEYDDLEVGAGMLIGVSGGKTIDQVILEAQQQVAKLNEHYSIPELNDEGEELSDQIIVHELKRNDDKTIQLNDKSKPITGANHTIRKRRIQIRQYVVKPVTADGDKISEDGALIVRVF